MDKLGVSLTHSDRFHQGIPEDYIEELLEANDPISFHHFTETNHRLNYDNRFRAADEMLINLKQQHEEKKKIFLSSL